MIVLHGGDYHLPGKEPMAAIPCIMQNLLAGFDKLNTHSEHVVISRKDTISSDSSQIIDGHEVHYIASRRPRIGTSLLRDIPLIRRKMRELNPDLVHAQNPFYAFCAQKENIPCVLTLHGMVWKEAGYNLRSKDASLRKKGIGQKLIYIPQLKKVFNRLQHLILINDYVREEIKGQFKNTTHLVENPISERFFRMHDTSSEENRIVFSMGVIGTRKNQFGLVKAVGKLNKGLVSNFSLMLAGNVQDKHYYQRILHFIKDKKMENVRILGRISSESLDDMYSKMSMFCLLSNQETAPMVISEAMACGKPVIASNVCGIPHMINDRNSGYVVEANNISDVANKITELLEDEKKRKEMGRNAREEAMKRWHPQVVAAKSMVVYEKVLENS